ncbi:MAG: 50S ribosomal protein L11 methyltransferase [Syntrophobacteraceae bacterium]|jgi:ribosomal protein L11 methyltransferase|nr:50S ribosomal protein L11 methyltransferase [Syntrophobacteraceae bacterium]
MNVRPNQRLFVYECLTSGIPAHGPGLPTLVGVWPEPPCTYLFFERPEDQTVNEWIRAHPGFELLGRYEMDYDQWQQVPQSDQQVGSFMIPARSDSPAASPQAGKKILRIDPGLVFGSGLHPTTRGCLLSLEVLFSQNRIHNVVDFGTGTGILAAASALLGARQVVAIDCNPLALRVARGNFEANGVREIIFPIVADDPAVVRCSWDLILMNIEWPCLTRIVSQPHWRSHSLAVLSGFLDSQRQTLAGLLPPSHVMIHEERHEGWCTVVLRAHTG